MAKTKKELEDIIAQQEQIIEKYKKKNKTDQPKWNPIRFSVRKNAQRHDSYQSRIRGEESNDLLQRSFSC